VNPRAVPIRTCVGGEVIEDKEHPPEEGGKMSCVCVGGGQWALA
jgi:hypothetical protein